MRTSVVVITYNSPRRLELVLRALARQSRLPDEVVVTDDGSSGETAELVREIAARYPVPLLYLWQEDEGARMSRARNRGIAAASGDYIVFLDGDMVAHHEFMADHLAFAKKGCFVQGSRVLVGKTRTERMLRDGALEVHFLESDIERRRHTLRLPPLARLYARPRVKFAGIKSCNWGFWRSDLLELNGFNEAMTGWGREDDELATRAFHLGLKRRDVRFAALAVHLWHSTRKRLEDNPNDAILAETRAGGTVRCTIGLDQHLTDSTRNRSTAPET